MRYPCIQGWGTVRKISETHLNEDLSNHLEERFFHKKFWIFQNAGVWELNSYIFDYGCGKPKFENYEGLSMVSLLNILRSSQVDGTNTWQNITR